MIVCCALVGRWSHTSSGSNGLLSRNTASGSVALRKSTTFLVLVVYRNSLVLRSYRNAELLTQYPSFRAGNSVNLKKGDTAIKIHRAQEFGLLTQKVGIAPNARVTYQLTRNGIVLRDLETSTQFTVAENGDVLEEDFNVPDNLKRIFNASDNDLKKQWDDSWEEGWTDERETIFTELVRRGVDMRPGR